MKKRSKSYSNNPSVRRVNNYNTTEKFTSPVLHPITIKKTVPQSLLPIEDLRRWKPAKILLKNTLARAAPVRVKFNPLKVLSYKFQLPKNAVVCVRRKIRKRVLFAKQIAGVSGGRKRPRFNQNSQYHC